MLQVLCVIFEFNVTLCVQCRYNLSELEEWLRSSRIYDKAMETTLEPLVQVAQLLQVKKRNEDDVDIICDTCTQLTVTQVINNNGLIDVFSHSVHTILTKVVPDNLKHRNNIGLIGGRGPPGTFGQRSK